jgi:hypothetical protein
MGEKTDKSNKAGFYIKKKRKKKSITNPTSAINFYQSSAVTKEGLRITTARLYSV